MLEKRAEIGHCSPSLPDLECSLGARAAISRFPPAAKRVIICDVDAYDFVVGLEGA